MAVQASTSLIPSNTGPSNGSPLYGSLHKAGNINIEPQGSRYDNITATDNSIQQNGDQYYNTVNNYLPTTHSDVPVKPPEDPIHTDFSRARREGQGPQRLSFLFNRGANIEHRDQQGNTQTCHVVYCDILYPSCTTIPSPPEPRSLDRQRVISSAQVGLAIDYGNVDAARFCLSLTSDRVVNGIYYESWHTDQVWRRASSKTRHVVGLAVAALDADMLRLLFENGIGIWTRESAQTCMMFLLGDVTTHRHPLNGKNASACISLLQANGVHKKCTCLDTGGDALLMTVIHYNRDDVRYEVAKAVLDNGGPVNATNQEGQTALMMAAASEQRSRVRCVELLCEHGAKIDLKDRAGRTALRHAEKWGGAEDYEEVRRILQHFGQKKRDSSFSFSGAMEWLRGNPSNRV